MHDSKDNTTSRNSKGQLCIQSLDQFLALFQGVKPAGENRWMALCPAHADTQQSLSIKVVGDAILIKCHAGCQTPDIVKAIGLTMADLFLGKAGAPSAPRRIVVVYPYHNARGELLFEVVRFEPKGFAQRRLLKDGSYAWNLRGISPVLYRLPEVITGIANSQIIYIVEGEKDADNLCKLGFIATTNPMGAGKWRNAYTESLRGADVVIIPDNDDPGRAHAEGVAQNIYSVAARVRILPVPHDISDVSAWIAAGATREVIEAAATSPWEPKPALDIHKFGLTDLGNAERLVARHGDNLRYNYNRNKWLVWTGRVWAWDDGARIMNMAKETVRSIYEEAGNEVNDDKRKELVSHATRSESGQRLSEMVKLAQSELPVDISKLDNKPWLFNCENGTVNLKTGELQPHRREDMLTIMAPVNYTPNAQSTLWEGFLDRVTASDNKLKSYLQRAVGYSLTADMRDEGFFFVYGLGCNGKTTFLKTIHNTMGEYGMKAQTSLLLVDKGSHRPKEELANLRGKRFVMVGEIGQRQVLDTNLLKDLTGGERVRADRKYEHETEFDPTEKLWLYGNHKPIVTDSTKAMWRRVRLIPFTVTIPDDEIDNTLRDKLSHELSAVLAWAVKGCIDWQLLGFDVPEAVKRATQSYREEEDILRDYIEACLEVKPSGRTPKKSLWSNYKGWCDENKLVPVSRARLSSLLVERGITDGKSGSVRYWAGIEIIGSPGSEEALPLEQEEAGQLGQLGQNSGNIPKTPTREISKGNFREHPSVASQMSRNDLWAGMPDSPHEPCPACGSTDFWPDFENKRFICCRCHPQLPQIDMGV